MENNGEDKQEDDGGRGGHGGSAMRAGDEGQGRRSGDEEDRRGGQCGKGVLREAENTGGGER